VGRAALSGSVMRMPCWRSAPAAASRASCRSGRMRPTARERGRVGSRSKRRRGGTPTDTARSFSRNGAAELRAFTFDEWLNYGNRRAAPRLVKVAVLTTDNRDRRTQQRQCGAHRRPDDRRFGAPARALILKAFRARRKSAAYRWRCGVCHTHWRRGAPYGARGAW
jgi:hypothetical protein